ncbi:MAG: hypothetical protein MJY65_03415 [Bacteroidaceae bacterium]|nr:hypothetical protein [Bacteroidaceae bacterium]
MKKSVIIATAAVMLAGLVSGCTKRYVTEEFITEEYYVDGDKFDVVYETAYGDSWKRNGRVGSEGCYLYQTIRVPEITEDVIENGAVVVYLVDADGRDNMLPYMRPYQDVYPFVYENIRCDVAKGELTIIIESSDFDVVVPSGDYSFKVVILHH